MEDIGDIIFYIVVAVIGIAGAIGKKRKKKATWAASSASETKTREMEDFLVVNEAAAPGIDYYTDGHSPGETKQSVEHKQKEEELIMDASLKGQYEEPLADDFANEGVSTTNDSISNNEPGDAYEIEKKDEDTWASELAEDFDLPKAIIYSEILKRKDFV